VNDHAIHRIIIIVVFIWLRPNSIMLSWSQTGPKLIADL